MTLQQTDEDILNSASILLEMKGVVTISYLAKEHIILHEWFEYNPEEGDEHVFEALDIIFKTMKDYQCAKVMVQVNHVKGAFSPDVLDYIKTVQFPRLLSETPLRYIATVVSEEHYEEVNSSLWKDQLLENKALIMTDVLSLSEGLKWLSQFS